MKKQEHKKRAIANMKEIKQEAQPTTNEKSQYAEKASSQKKTGLAGFRRSGRPLLGHG